MKISLENCFEEEESAYRLILAIQELIRVKGGTPKYAITQIKIETPRDSIARRTYLMKKTVDDLRFTFFSKDYNPSDTWENKTIYVLEKMKGAAAPNKIIEYLTMLEKEIPIDKISGNVYNSLHRLVKDGRISKAESSSGNTMYLINEKALHFHMQG